MKQALKISEVLFLNCIEIDFHKNKKLLYGINAFSFVFFALFYLLLNYLTIILNINPANDIFYHFKATRYLPVSANIIFLGGLFLILIIHELIHGYFFYYYTREKPLLGFKSVYAYAAAPGWYIHKNPFRVVTLSPLVVITFAGIILMLLTAPGYSSIIFILVTVNAAGSAGDMWMIIKLMDKPEDTYVNDLGIAAKISFNRIS